LVSLLLYCRRSCYRRLLLLQLSRGVATVMRGGGTTIMR